MPFIALLWLLSVFDTGHKQTRKKHWEQCMLTPQHPVRQMQWPWPRLDEGKRGTHVSWFGKGIPSFPPWRREYRVNSAPITRALAMETASFERSRTKRASSGGFPADEWRLPPLFQCV
ncbi:hypothetical protein B0T10DRAFT_470598 [Thelonectria olida]|uniref:Secreted protein n=1 Tax=Thelonectria olida TaxID=1576542 RepID=A0A9P8WIT3_9HYPO|nr:hypothetical protein B0T10DRAFT_470598 [Thelonectria olida]